jgi:hypothetical protein
LEGRPVPLNAKRKPSVPVIPLPALLLRQVPFGKIKDLLFNFDNQEQIFLGSCDPTVFTASRRERLISRYIECEAKFTSIKLLTNVKSSTADATPVNVVLYTASRADFILGL